MLCRLFGCVRLVYNEMLALRKLRWVEDGESVGFAHTSRVLTEVKREGLEFLREVSSVPLQQCLRQLDQAYRNFFDGRAKYPRFRSRRGVQSACFTRSGFTLEGRNLCLAKIGRIKVRWSRELASFPSSVTIIKDCAGRYFVSCVVEKNEVPFPCTGLEAGFDLGINSLLVGSDGSEVGNPRFLDSALEKLGASQRVLARRVKGSGRWGRQRLVVAKCHAHVADSRRDYSEKLTTGMTRKYDRMFLEDLHPRGMVRNRRLARSLSDASLGMARSMLESKAVRYGKTVGFVDRFFPSSKLCSACGLKNDALTLAQREWTCSGCLVTHDRDANASRNILAEGRSVAARGGRVRHTGSLNLCAVPVEA